MATKQTTKRPRVTAPASGSFKYTNHTILAIMVGLCGYIWWVTGVPRVIPKHQKPELTANQVTDAPITLVSADKTDLACASDLEVDGMHCAFNGSKEPWPNWDVTDPSIRKKTLAPYMTVDNVLFLIPGLFEQPAVDERYREDGARRDRKQQERFTAQCKLKAIRQIEGAHVRWIPKGDWQGPKKAWIGEVSDCSVFDP